MADLEFRQNRLAQPHPLQAFEIGRNGSSRERLNAWIQKTCWSSFCNFDLLETDRLNPISSDLALFSSTYVYSISKYLFSYINAHKFVMTVVGIGILPLRRARQRKPQQAALGVVAMLAIVESTLRRQSHPTSGNGMAHLEFGQDRLAQPHPLQPLELAQSSIEVSLQSGFVPQQTV